MVRVKKDPNRPPDPRLVQLGALMASLRAEAGMTREQVVVAMGRAPSTQAQLSRMESGMVATQYDTLLEWAAVFGYTIRVVPAQ
jgi:transcriptional regulator with XRE-family HTH domain